MAKNATLFDFTLEGEGKVRSALGGFVKGVRTLGKEVAEQGRKANIAEAFLSARSTHQIKQRLKTMEKSVVDTSKNIITPLATTDEGLKSIEKSIINVRLAESQLAEKILPLREKYNALIEKGIDNLDAQEQMVLDETKTELDGLDDTIKQHQRQGKMLEVVRKEYRKLSGDGPPQLKKMQAEINAQIDVTRYKQQQLLKQRVGLKSAQEFEKWEDSMLQVQNRMDDLDRKSRSLPERFAAMQRGEVVEDSGYGGYGGYDDYGSDPTAKLTEKVRRSSEMLSKYGDDVIRFAQKFEPLKQALAVIGVTDAVETVEGVSEALDLFADKVESTMEFLENNSDTVNKVIGKLAPSLLGQAAASSAVGTASAAAGAGATGAAGGLAAMATAAGPFLLIAIAIAPALVAITKAFQMQKEAAEAAAAAGEGAAKAQLDDAYRKLELDKLITQAQQGDIEAREEIISRLAEAKSTYTNEANRMNEAEELMADAQQRLAAAQSEYAAMGFNPFDKVTNAIEEGLSQNVTQIQSEVDRYQQELDSFYLDSEGNIGSLEQARREMQDLEQSAQELGLTEQEWNRIIQNQIGNSKEAERAAQALAQAQDDLVQLYEELDSTMIQHAESLREWEENQMFQRGREMQDRARADARSERDFHEQIQDMTDDFHDAETDAWDDYYEQLAASFEDFQEAEADALEDLGKQLREMEIDFQKQMADMREDYNKQRKEAIEDHQKEMAKSEEEYNFQRLRRLEDLQDQLFELELANDVLGYIQAQRAGEKEDRRAQEDFQRQQEEAERQFREQMAEQKEQFEEQMAEAKEQYAEQKADARKNYEEQKAERLEQYQEQQAEQKEQFDKQRADALEQYNQQLVDQQEAYDKQRALEEEERAFQDQRRQEDLDRELQQMEEQFDKELTATKAKEADLLKIIDSGGYYQAEKKKYWEMKQVSTMESIYKDSITRLRSMAQSAFSGLNTGGSSGGTAFPTSSGGGSGSSSRSGRGLLAAEGALIKKPTLLVAGEGNKPELVMPFDQSQGIPPGVLGGPTVAINIGSIAFSGGITQAEFESQMIELQQVLVEAVTEAVS